MRKFVLLGLCLLAFSSRADAQSGQTVTLQPVPLTAVNASGAVASTNTFQSVFAAAGPAASTALRYGCLLINTSTAVQYVFFGPIASATTPKSIPLNPASSAGQAGGQASCPIQSGGVVQDQISITGTTGGTFLAIRN